MLLSSFAMFIVVSIAGLVSETSASCDMDLVNILAEVIYLFIFLYFYDAMYLTL